MTEENKLNHYVSSIHEAFSKKDFEGVKNIWEQLMNEKVEVPCGREPNVNLITSVRNKTIDIVLFSMKRLNL